MKETPILFNTEMVIARKEDRKSQTRRLNGLKEINMNPDDWVFEGFSERAGILYAWFQLKEYPSRIVKIKCPWGNVGSLLWIKETFCNANMKWDTCDKLCFKASVKGCRHANYQKGWPSWTPSILMPKSACRLWEEITNIRIELVQDITESDAESEGCIHTGCHSAKDNFEDLWDSINFKRGYPLESNPWVWVVDFKRIEK